MAWATGARPSSEFSRSLRALAGLSKSQFRRILEECRQGRLPLLETLVDRGLLSVERARAVLVQQLEAVLNELARFERVDLLFLQRNREHERPELTVELSDLALFSEPARSTVRPSSGLVHRICTEVSGVSWVEFIQGETVIEQEPSGILGRAPVGRAPIALVQHTLLDGAEFVALRSGRGALVGVALGEQRTLWCRVSASAAFRAAAAVHSSFVAAEPAPFSSSGWVDGLYPPSWVRGKGPLVSALGDFFHRSPELLAAFVLLSNGDWVGVGDGSLSSASCEGIVGRRASAFQVPADAFAGPQRDSEVELEDLGFRFRSLTTVEERAWCFATELDIEGVGSVWIFVRRSARLQVGWSALGALACFLEALPSHSL